MPARTPEEIERMGAEALKQQGSPPPEGASAPNGEEKREDLSVDEALAKRAQLKASLLQILDRGLVNDRLKVEHLIPADRYPVFVRERAEDIALYQGMGFRVEEVDPSKQPEGSSHGAGDSRYRVGDVILMTAPKVIGEIMKELDAERTASKLTQGKREFRTGMGQLSGTGVSPFQG